MSGCCSICICLRPFTRRWLTIHHSRDRFTRNYSRYANCEAILPSHANWGYTYEGGPIMVAWSPWHTLETLRRELDKVFDESGPRTAPAFRTAFLPGRAARRYPLMNLYEDQEAVYLEALAPGVDSATLDLNVMGNTLSITGEKRRAGD